MLINYVYSLKCNTILKPLEIVTWKNVTRVTWVSNMYKVNMRHEPRLVLENKLCLKFRYKVDDGRSSGSVIIFMEVTICIALFITNEVARSATKWVVPRIILSGIFVWKSLGIKKNTLMQPSV